MKTLILLAIAVAITIETSTTTLAESGTYRFTIKFSQNSSNSSNSDVALGLTVGSMTAPLTSSYFASGACINVGTSNYQLTTTSTTLKGFGIEWQCHSTCAYLAAVYNSVTFYAGANWGQTTAHVVSSQSTLTSVSSPSGTNSNNSTAKTVSYTFYGLTPTQLASSVYMPNQTETWYVRCFARFNNPASVGFSGGIYDLETTIGNGRNLSLSGSTISSLESQKARFWAIFSMAKTILAYLT
ncbi:unnamed protein product [Moneuplotes crassus]|uniref:DOMON domain-containing protein n=1 Tax=Euplotes crassus TaxID=5936 RepID=A0AAD2D426_EUPCR|nr:unnamed protein product [Moneuplotes crassus]